MAGCDITHFLNLATRHYIFLNFEGMIAKKTETSNKVNEVFPIYYLVLQFSSYGLPNLIFLCVPQIYHPQLHKLHDQIYKAFQ